MQDKRILLVMLSSIAAFLVSTPALAIMSVPDGWYLEGNVGSSHLSNESYPGSSSSSGVGGNINLGYKFMPYLGTEVEYTQYANTTIKDSTDTKAATDKHYSYGLVARGILPLMTSGAELFARLGVQRLNSHISIDNSTAASNIGISSSTHSATGLYYGLGAQYYFMPELAANIQWAQAQGNDNTGNSSLFSGGLSFIFD